MFFFSSFLRFLPQNIYVLAFSSDPSLPTNIQQTTRTNNNSSAIAMRPGRSFFISSPPLSTGAGIEYIYHNQVLVTALTASVLGQILKPFASALQGKGLDWKLVIRSGGMPSTHSAFVTAACTALALQRGFSDSLFGISLVYAAIVMYDAQGVRRAVGKQAEVINTMLLKTVRDTSTSRDKTARTNGSGTAEDLITYAFEAELESLVDAESSSVRLRTGATAASFDDIEDISSSLPTGKQSEILQRTPTGPVTNVDLIDAGSGAFNRSENFFKVVKKFPSIKGGQVIVQELESLNVWQHVPLKESVGHTKLEVLFGGLWGISIALALENLVESVPQ